MKLSMAFHPLHGYPLSTIAPKQRHGWAHPLYTGEIRAAVRKALIVGGALFLEGEAQRISSGKASARAPTGAAETSLRDEQGDQQRAGLPAKAASSVTAARRLHSPREGTRFVAAARSATSSGRRASRGRGRISRQGS